MRFLAPRIFFFPLHCPQSRNSQFHFPGRYGSEFFCSLLYEISHAILHFQRKVEVSYSEPVYLLYSTLDRWKLNNQDQVLLVFQVLSTAEENLFLFEGE